MGLFSGIGNFLGGRSARKTLNNVGRTTDARLDNKLGEFTTALQPFIDRSAELSNIANPGITSLLSELATPTASGLDPSTQAAIQEQTRRLSDQFAARGLSRSGELLDTLNEQNTNLILQREPALQAQRQGLAQNRLATLLGITNDERQIATSPSRTGLDVEKLKAGFAEKRGVNVANANIREKSGLGEILGGAASALGGLF